MTLSVPQTRVWWLVAKQLCGCNWIAGLHFTLERCEESITLSRWGLYFLILFQYLRRRTLEKKCYSFSHPGFYQCVHKMKLQQNNVFHSNHPSPLALLTTITLELFPLLDVYTVYNRKKSVQKKERKCFASTFLGVNAASPNRFSWQQHTLAHFGVCGGTWEGWGGSLTKIHNSCCPLEGLDQWHCVEEVLSSCSGLFLYSFTIPICSQYSDAMPSLD